MLYSAQVRMYAVLDLVQSMGTTNITMSFSYSDSHFSTSYGNPFRGRGEDRTQDYKM